VAFRLVHAKFDERTLRAYVEFRDKDHDGGEVVVTTIFSFRPLNPLNHKQVKEEIIRNARHLARCGDVWPICHGDSPKTKSPGFRPGLS
jgi:hypothetical protein